MKKSIRDQEFADNAHGGPSRAKVCVICEKPFSNPLALALRDQNLAVDFVCLKEASVEGAESFRDAGSSQEAAGTLSDHDSSVILDVPASSSWQVKSYACLEYVLSRSYDIVLVSETQGLAYYPLLAKRTGNDRLRETSIYVLAHGCLRPSVGFEPQPATWENLCFVEMARRSLELADGVVAPASAVMARYRSYGWDLPSNTFVNPRLFLPKLPPLRGSSPETLREVVYFGQLDYLHGLWMFCRALDRIQTKLSDFSITFLGGLALEAGVSTDVTLLRLSMAWPFKINLLTDLDEAQALDYLQGSGRLAVIARPDNSMSAVSKCLGQGTPFLVPDTSDAAELLDPESRQFSLFDCSAEGLSRRLTEVLQCGVLRQGRSEMQEECREVLELVGRTQTSSAQVAPGRCDGTNQQALVIIVTRQDGARNAAHALEQALRAYEGDVQGHALAEDPIGLREALAQRDLAVDVSALENYETVAEALSLRGGIVGLCHVSQIVPPIWMDRARRCFALDRSIMAITGMTRADRYLLGRAPSLFALMKETNCGFAILQSELFRSRKNVEPRDKQHGGCKGTRDWIHELLVTAHCEGMRFELVPDLPAPNRARDYPLDQSALCRFMRSISSHRYEPGSDGALLSRLSTDFSLNLEQGVENTVYLEDLQSKIGCDTLVQLQSCESQERYRLLSQIARAGGKIELAEQLERVSAIMRASDAEHADIRDPAVSE